MCRERITSIRGRSIQSEMVNSIFSVTSNEDLGQLYQELQLLQQQLNNFDNDSDQIPAPNNEGNEEPLGDISLTETIIIIFVALLLGFGFLFLYFNILIRITLYTIHFWL